MNVTIADAIFTAAHCQHVTHGLHECSKFRTVSCICSEDELDDDGSGGGSENPDDMDGAVDPDGHDDDDSE